MEKVIVKYDNYKNWIITNIAYIATAVSGGYIIKSLYDFYSSYTYNCSLNQKIAYILKIELAKRKQLEKQTKGGKFKCNFHIFVELVNNNNESITQSIYLDEEAKNRVSNLKGDGIQAYFFSRFNTQTNNNIKEEDNNSTTNLNSNTQNLNKKKKADVEFFFYAFYKCFMTIYEKEIAQFQLKRREVYKQGNIVKYISFVEKSMTEFRYLEEYILRQVFNELKVNDSIESDVKLADINTKNISTKFYEDLELELPNTLNLEKINEVIVCLFDQTKINLNKIQSLMNLSSSALTDNEYLIAENMAFDYAFQKYNYSENQIRKAVVNYNLSFAIESENN